MTESSALDPYIAMCLAQSALEADTFKNWIPTKRGAPYPHIAMGHSMFLVCIGVSGAIDKHFFTFSEGKIIQTQFHIWQGRVFTLHLSKKIQKLIEKHEVREHLKNSVHRNVKNFNENFCKKQFHRNFYKTLSPEKSESKMNEMQKSQPPLHMKNPQKQQFTASENQKRSKLRSPTELTVCASSRWSSRQTPINGSEAKKRGLRYTMCQKTM